MREEAGRGRGMGERGARSEEADEQEASGHQVPSPPGARAVPSRLARRAPEAALMPHEAAVPQPSGGKLNKKVYRQEMQGALPFLFEEGQLRSQSCLQQVDVSD